MGNGKHSKINSEDEVVLRVTSPNQQNLSKNDRNMFKKINKKKRNKKNKKKDKKNMLDLQQPDKPHVTRVSIRLKESDYDQVIKERMQIQLAEHASTFLLNQIMSSVQFFGNYDSELSSAVEMNRKEENQKTSKMERHCKSVIMPDRLHEAFNQRVKFQARHGRNKNKIVPLHSQTIYIVHDNIEITHPGDSAVYSTVIEASNYKMVIDVPKIGQEKKKTKKHTGFIKLKSLETIRKQNRPDRVNRDFYGIKPTELDLDDDVEEEENDEEEEYDYSQAITSRPNFRDSMMIISKPKLKTFNSLELGSNNINNNNNNINSLTPSPPSSEYDYIYMTALNTHQPLSVMRASRTSDYPVNTTSLPESCFINIRETTTLSPEHSDYESDEEYHELKQSFHSKSFLAYFINMFQETLANDLGFNRKDLERATWKGAIIYIAQWEISPAIHCPWPTDAFEWLHRQRRVDTNPLTKIKYQWPSPAMINKVMGLGCNAVPIGYSSNRNNINPDREFEWRIVFPKAERFLESYLSSAQVKVYMVVKSLIKTFVEPFMDNNANMFTSEHIRHHLFWQCEDNYLAWSEESLGESLLKYFNTLLVRISHQKLPDYFLPKRNLFENIPEAILFSLHKRILRITENPVMHVLIALKNLKFLSKKFYPKFKYKKLYSALVVKDPITLLNPLFRTSANMNISDQDSDVDDDDDDNTVGVGLMGEYEKNEKYDKSKKKKTIIVKFQVQEKLKKRTMPRKVSVESIDTSYEMMSYLTPCLRRKIVYELFIQHYIEMAVISYSFKSQNQGIIYLKQAERLCNLLHDDEGKSEARDYITKILPIRNDIMSSISRESYGGPALPRRESMLEPENKLRVRVTLNKQKSIPEDDDPYSNIEIIKSQAIQPTDEFISNNTPILKKKNINVKEIQLNGSINKTTLVQIHTLRENESCNEKNDDNKSKILVNDYKSIENNINEIKEQESPTKEIQSLDKYLESMMINKQNNNNLTKQYNAENDDEEDEDEYDTSF